MITEDYPAPPGEKYEEAEQDIEEDGGHIDDYIPEGEENGLEADESEEIEWISRPIEEIVDENNQLTRTPPVPSEQYPSLVEFMAFFETNAIDFGVRRGFSEPEFVENQYYYHISFKYVRKLIDWATQGAQGRTGTFLAIDHSNIYKNLPQGRNHRFQYLDEVTWNQLLAWFGGGIALKIRCVDGHVSSRGVLVRVIPQKENNKFRRFYFSPYETIEFAKLVICDTFDIEPSECRLHDFFNYKPQKRLDRKRDLHKSLDEEDIVADNLLFLEFPDEDGEFKLGAIVNKITGKKRPEGIVGFKNLGNTCYMNSILQCLSNVPLLKDSFLSKQYVEDINKDNVLGYEGKVANAFSALMELMWSGKGSVVDPAKFKQIVTTAKPDFAGFEQHDSQEFLSQLLDAIHEDINRIKKKPPTDKVEANGRPDAVVAEQSLETYKSRNDSIIADLFLGLYKSTVTCPAEACTNVSVTFDPYMIIPLPLQTKESYYQVLQVVYVSRNPKTPVRRMRIIAPKHGPGFILKEILREKLGINRTNQQDRRNYKKNKHDKEITIAQGFPDFSEEVVGKRDVLIFPTGYSQNSLYRSFFGDRDPLSTFNESSVVVCFESFKTLQFENFCFEDSGYWKRKLHAKRPKPKRVAALRNYQSPELDYDDDISESEYEELPDDHPEKLVIGFLNCPFASGDLWLGDYMYKDTLQAIRLEISTVDRMDWSHYREYKGEIRLLHGDIDHVDASLTEENFNMHEVYEIVAVADTKYQQPAPVTNTAFEMRGVYIHTKQGKTSKSKSSSENQKSKRERKKSKSKREKNSNRGLFKYGSKRNNRKKDSVVSGGSKSKRSQRKPKVEQEDIENKTSNNENLYKVSRQMKAGTLEDKLTHGIFVLRPTEMRKIFRARNPQLEGFDHEDPDVRQPIVLTGKVENNFRYCWGKFQVEQGFTKGEFSMQIYETSNWNHRCGKSIAINPENEILNWTRFPLASNRDNRILVMLCHRELKGFRGVPEVFFLPNAISEGQAVGVIQHRLALYYKKEEILGKTAEQNDKEESLDGIDPVVTFLKTVKVVRANSRFSTKAKPGDYQGIGEILDGSVETPLRIDDYVIRLVAYWPKGYPFERARPTKCLKLLQSDEEKMTLDKALTLFQKTDRLSAMNAWYCSKCKAHQEAFKQLQIWSLPKVLVIQFKRFSQDEGRSTADKLEIPVDFPFSLDLADITLSSHVVEEAGESLDADVKKSNNFLSSYNYELVAVSSHVGGGLGQGHYIASAKNKTTGKWYEFNDATVTEIGEDFSRVVNPKAYVLFYINSEYNQSNLQDVKGAQ